MSVSVPSDKICVRLMRPDGSRNDFLLGPADTVGTMKKHIFDNWPEEWRATSVDSEKELRIIHQGRFLQDAVALKDCGAPVGQMTVMHLAPKASVSQEQPVQAEAQDVKTTGCTCVLL
eukprot:Opistho-2@21445